MTHLKNSRFILVLNIQSPGILRDTLRELLTTLSTICVVSNVNVGVSTDVNIALCPGSGRGTSALLHRTSRTVCGTGRDNHGHLRLFSMSGSGVSGSTFSAMVQIHRTLRSNRLYLRCRPGVDLDDKTIVNFRTLLH